MTAPRVVLVDDHELVRAGLAELLAAADDIEVLATAADGREAIQVVERASPQVVLMDLSMPGMDGVEATRRILSVHPAVRVVALTSASDARNVMAALDAGAIGYLLKDATPEELRAGIRAARARRVAPVPEGRANPDLGTRPDRPGGAQPARA